MNYMLDKINTYENGEKIKEMASKIVKLLKDCENLNDSERLMTIELAVCKLNYELYGISGDK